MPLAHLITPNLPEAGALLGQPSPATARQWRRRRERLLGLGPANVLLKGGHLAGATSPDLLLSGGERLWLESTRIATRHTHGTGCTLSSAITALLARGRPLPDAVAEAKRWLTEAIAAGDGLGIGHGIGPVHHFHALWPALDEAGDGCLTPAPGLTIGIALARLSGHARCSSGCAFAWRAAAGPACSARPASARPRCCA